MNAAAIYVRVSTGDQHVSNQLPETELLAKSRGWNVVGIYSEKVSAAAKTRPEFERMLADAHKGKFNYVVVWSVDRLGRSMLGNLSTILDLDRKGIRLVSVREGWLDTDGHVRHLLLGVLSWISEQERVRLGERVRAGITRARKQGVRLGRPPAMIDLQRAIELQSGGSSLRTIARTLGCSSSSLQRLLASQNPQDFDPQKSGKFEGVEA